MRCSEVTQPCACIKHLKGLWETSEHSDWLVKKNTDYGLHNGISHEDHGGEEKYSDVENKLHALAKASLYMYGLSLT